MAKVTFTLGPEAKYNVEDYKDSIYFTTDTLKLFLNGDTYGSTISSVNLSLNDSYGILSLVDSNGITLSVVIPEVNTSLAGLMTSILCTQLADLVDDPLLFAEEITEEEIKEMWENA